MARVMKDRRSRPSHGTEAGMWQGMFSRSTIVTLAIAWVTTIVFLTVGHEFVAPS